MNNECKLLKYKRFCPKEGKITIQQSQEEMSAILYAYDYGIDAATVDAKDQIYSLIAKLKDKIWI